MMVLGYTSVARSADPYFIELNDVLSANNNINIF